ncbi:MULTISPECIES: hypothetical protein [Sinorhizobium/Ensifer group]|uniref:hypothetical protein n=1 Tax=Sinorhizobium/Ensifer group TaxID=227292 RepID=UPI0012E35CD0|nr:MULTISPECIES: hypothetical protein [Sinorhizobium/Ensifer group]MBV7516146.1 hypothetical protein [Ensifer sp. ENS12]
MSTLKPLAGICGADRRGKAHVVRVLPLGLPICCIVTENDAVQHKSSPDAFSA